MNGAAAEAVDLLVHSARVITVDGEDRVFPDGAVAVRGGAIVAVGRSDELRQRHPAASVLDAQGGLVLPGLIDTHLHPALALLLDPAPRADEAAGPWPGPTGLRSDALAPGPLATGGQPASGAGMLGFLQQMGDADAVPPLAIYTLALHSLWLALRGGTTCFVEGGGGAADAVAQAALDIGIRAGVGPALWDRLPVARGGTIVLDTIGDAEAQLQRAEATLARWHGAGSGRVQGWVVLHTDITSSDALLQGAARLARQHAVGLTMHAASAVAQQALSRHLHGRGGIERLHRLGVLGPQWLGVHMGAAERDDLPLLRDAQARVAHCVSTSNANGKGFVASGRIWQMMEAGIEVGLGTDTLFSGGLPSQMRAFRAQHKECQADNRVVPPYQALLRATRHAARCVQRAHEIGSLEVGKRADLIVVDTAEAEHVFGDPLASFIDRGGESQVRHVVVDGRLVLQNRRLQTLDEAELLSQVHQTLAVKQAMGAVK